MMTTKMTWNSAATPFASKNQTFCKFIPTDIWKTTAVIKETKAKNTVKINNLVSKQSISAAINRQSEFTMSNTLQLRPTEQASTIFLFQNTSCTLSNVPNIASILMSIFCPSYLAYLYSRYMIEFILFQNQQGSNWNWDHHYSPKHTFASNVLWKQQPSNKTTPHSANQKSISNSIKLNNMK